MEGNLKKTVTISFFVLLAGAVITGLIWYSGSKARALAFYNNATLRISFKYPAAWQSDPKSGGDTGISARYTGATGFFGLDSIGGDEKATIDDLTSELTSSQFKSYGSKPAVVPGTIDAHETRMIIPSDDQDAALVNQAVLVIRYLKPVTLNGKSYQFLVLYADRDHIRSLANTVKMLDK